MESQQNECLSTYDGDVTLSPGGPCVDGQDRTMEEDDGSENCDDRSPKLHLNVEVADGNEPSLPRVDDAKSSSCNQLTLDISATNAAPPTTTLTPSSQEPTTAVFKVPESPATTCKLNYGGPTTRGRKTSLTGISTGSNGSTSSGVSSMTSEPFEGATVVAGGKTEVTSCSNLDLAAQRRVTGSTSSFSLEEEEDVNDVYSRLEEY